MLSAIFHNFPLGGIISCCNYCLQELHQSEGAGTGQVCCGLCAHSLLPLNTVAALEPTTSSFSKVRSQHLFLSHTVETLGSQKSFHRHKRVLQPVDDSLLRRGWLPQTCHRGVIWRKRFTSHRVTLLAQNHPAVDSLLWSGVWLSLLLTFVVPPRPPDSGAGGSRC